MQPGANCWNRRLPAYRVQARIYRRRWPCFPSRAVRVAGGPVGANDTDQSRLRKGRTNKLPHKTARASGNGRFFRDSTSAGQDRRTALMGLFPEIARDAMLHGVFREFRDGANPKLLHNSSLVKLRRLDGNAQ